ncbi:MAG TPA: methyltransferase domain-containing protein [Alphaproteobacteria bacterium]|nr:methyltransferase domain-containing protein [Alphaproteobacteria bacterium]
MRAPFEDADAESDFAGLVDYLDALEKVPVVAEVKQCIASAVAACDPRLIAEIGCGNGEMTARLARLCPSVACAVGFDFSERFAATASGRHGHGRAAFAVADAATLPCPSGRFDAVAIERVLMHIEDPFAVIAEAARILRRSGRLVICETDWRALRIEHPDAALTARMASGYIEIMKSPYVARDLAALTRKAGLDLLEVKQFAATVSAEDADTLLNFTRMRTFAIADGVLPNDADRWFADIRRMAVPTHIAFDVLTCGKS